MSNKDLMPTSVPEISTLGKLFFESGMFADIKSAAQAVVKISAGREIGIPPFAAMSGIHIIQGKPSIGAGLMASMVKGSGKYDYKVVKQDEKICSIDFYQGKDMIGNSTFTIEDAKKAQTKNIDKFPKNMLFARAMSNGVKWYTPDVFAGPVYTPEEMNETIVTEDVKHDIVEKPVIKPGELKKAKERLESGEDIISKVTETYTITAKDGQSLQESVEIGKKFLRIKEATEPELMDLWSGLSAQDQANPVLRGLFDVRSKELNPA